MGKSVYGDTYRDKIINGGSMMQKVWGAVMLLFWGLILYFGIMINYGR